MQHYSLELLQAVAEIGKAARQPRQHTMTQGTKHRVAYSPGEFAELFGKSQTWGYHRQIYAGKVKAITEHGRILIPANEVERILESAGIYNDRPTPKQPKASSKKLSPEQQSIWQRFVAMRLEGSSGTARTSPKPQSRPVASGSGSARAERLGRIARAWKREPEKGR